MTKTHTYIILLTSILLGFSSVGISQSVSNSPFKKVNTKWVDSVYSRLTLDEKIGQLFMIAAYSDPKFDNFSTVKQLVQDHKVGGIIFFKGYPTTQLQYTNILQKASKTPLLIGIDGEWGLAMRLDSTISFPKQMMLGAIQDNKLIYKMGVEIANECKRMGIHINFAPTIDINNNPNNPVINNRSFGEIKENVALKGTAYMEGMQSQRLLCTAKHFPGHGDTDSDSHKELPLIAHGKTRLDTLELYPFKHIIKKNVTGMMIAHLYIPELDKTKKLPSTLSPKIVTQLLQKDLGFQGLIFTDALNMKGISANFKIGEREIKAIQAGNDVLLFPEDVPRAIVAIKEAISKGDLTEEMINVRCKKILIAKAWAGLDSLKLLSTKNLIADLNNPKAIALDKSLIRSAITVVKDTHKQLPITSFQKHKIAYVSFIKQDNNAFLDIAKLYTKVTPFFVPTSDYPDNLGWLLDSLSKYTTVIVNIEATSAYATKKYGIPSVIPQILAQISKSNNIILVVHANPYSLDFFTESTPNISAIVMAYDFSQKTQSETVQVIFGGYGASGKLPVSAGGFKSGTGISYPSAKRLRYAEPGSVGMNAETLQYIDSIALDGIKKKAFPGCQVVVAKNGTVIYGKAFGTLSYESPMPVTNNTIYDIASITKVAASTISLMQLYDKKLFSVDSTLGSYLPYFKGTTKDSLVFRDILTHQSGLFPWIPFYQYMIKDYHNSEVKLVSKKRSENFPYKISDGAYLSRDYIFKDSSISNTRSPLYSLKIGDRLFINPTWKDSIYSIIASSPFTKRKEPTYSDLGFILIADIIKNITNESIDEYTNKEFYSKIGASSICYNPLRYFPKEDIAPTEYDEVFRKQLIHGHVHDPAAAMLGGISGHAGLFSNAHDLAKLFQMLLNKGTYGSDVFISPKTVDLFTACQFCNTGNRKGLGFDKAEVDSFKVDNTCKCTSPLSYGHTGFTGTMAWADPANGLVYIFLSNRVNPSADNKLISSLSIRSRIQKIIYDAILQNPKESYWIDKFVEETEIVDSPF